MSAEELAAAAVRHEHLELSTAVDELHRALLAARPYVAHALIYGRKADHAWTAEARNGVLELVDCAIGCAQGLL